MKRYKEPDFMHELHKIRREMSKIPLKKLIERWEKNQSVLDLLEKRKKRTENFKD